jgi:parallel beta-helix repeat protein
MLSPVSPALLLLASGTAIGADFYITTKGDDTNPGTSQKPLATLRGARDKIRELRAKPDYKPEPMNIWLAEGKYFFDECCFFEAQDSGMAEAPVVISALPESNVRIIGGTELTDWAPYSESKHSPHVFAGSRANVVVSDLKAQGVTELGSLEPRGWNSAMAPAPVELFQEEHALNLAAWPYRGWANATKITGTNQVEIPGELAKKLQGQTDIWAHGFWNYNYADSCSPVARIDANSQTLALDESADIKQPLVPNARYRLLNVLPELDSPGEYYVDREAGLVYLWPAQPLAVSPVITSQLETILAFQGAEHITVRGITLEAARVMGVEIADGSRVTLEKCTLRNFGNLGVNIRGGEQHCVTACEIYHTGEGGLRVEGGDRATLKEAFHNIGHNHIHHYARHSVAFRPGVEVHGVGITVANNEIFAAGGPAVTLHGNEHLVENNHVHHVCTEADDVGAIYLGHNPTYRGNKIRHNYLHDLGGFSKIHVMAIYLDDFASGTTVYGNTVVHAGRGVAIGGGRDNDVRNNVFVDCTVAVQADCRGETWAKARFSGDASLIARDCQEVKHDQEPYASRYPTLKNILRDDAAFAKGNAISSNLVSSLYGIVLQDGLDANNVALARNLRLQSQQAFNQWFVDSRAGNWQLKKDAPFDKIDFVAIPWEQIGPKLRSQSTTVAGLPR